MINKRAGGMGLIVGRKAFQRPMGEGAALIQAIQDVYLTTRSPSPSPEGAGLAAQPPTVPERGPVHRTPRAANGQRRDQG